MKEGGLTNLALQVFYVSREETNCPLLIEMIKTGKNLKEKEILTDKNSATISMKYGKRILINSNVEDFSKLKKEELIEVVDYNPLNNNLLIIGPSDPKTETTLHWMIHHARNEVNVVVQINDKKLLEKINENKMLSIEKSPIHNINFIKQALKKLRNEKKIFIKDTGIIYVGKSPKEITKMIEEDLK